MADAYGQWLLNAQQLHDTSQELVSRSKKLQEEITKLREELEAKGDEQEEVRRQLDEVKEKQMEIMGAFGPRSAGSNTALTSGENPVGHATGDSATNTLDVNVQEEGEESIRVAPSRRDSNIRQALEVIETPTGLTITQKDLYSLDTTYSVPPTDLWTQCEKVSSIHNKFPTVVLLNGEWVEVSCKTCGANAPVHSKDKTKSFFTDLEGVLKHVRRAHKKHGQKLSAHEALGQLDHRKVNEEDVALMRHGKDPKVAIEPYDGRKSRKKVIEIDRRSTQQRSEVAADSTLDVAPNASIPHASLTEAASPSGRTAVSFINQKTPSSIRPQYGTFKETVQNKKFEGRTTAYDEIEKIIKKAQSGDASLPKKRRSSQNARKTMSQSAVSDSSTDDCDYEDDDDEEEDNLPLTKRSRYRA